MDYGKLKEFWREEERNVSVTEMWEPNVKLCKEKLEPLGIEVKEVFDDKELPFKNDTLKASNIDLL